MSERCFVRLSIPKRHYARVMALLEESTGEPEFEQEGVHECTLEFDEVPQGDLGILQVLRDERIAYEQRTDPIAEAPAWVERFSLNADGTVRLHEFAQEREGMLSLQEVEQAFREGRLEAHLEEKKRFFAEIDWAEQEVVYHRLALSLPDAQDEAAPSGGPRM